MDTTTENQFVANLVASCKQGYSFPGAFYFGERIYRAEIERI